MHTHCGPLLASFILPFMLHFPSLLAIFVQLRLGHHPRVAAPCIASSAWIATVRFARAPCKRTVAFAGLEFPSRLCPRARTQDLKKYKKMKEARKKRGEDVSDSAEDA